MLCQNAASGKLLLMAYEPSANNLYFQRWNSVTSFNSQVSVRGVFLEFNWFRVTRVGTTIEYWLSSDGLDWRSIGTTQKELSAAQSTASDFQPTSIIPVKHSSLVNL